MGKTLQVELLGYASGDDHLYLVYEFVQNGSLSDHLHDPLKKGTQIIFQILEFLKNTMGGTVP